MNEKTELFPGKTHIFVCSALTGSVPIVFEWTKNDRKITQFERAKVEVIDTVSTLVLRNITKSDSGLVTCKAKNAFGEDSTFTRLIIKGFQYFKSYIQYFREGSDNIKFLVF